MSNKTPEADSAKTESGRKLRRIVPIALVAGLLATGGVYALMTMGEQADTPATQGVCETNPELETATISAPGKTLEAELAETQDQKYKGLSGHSCLEDNRAMLFPYESEGNYCFVMRDMNFPIDMIWLDEDKKVVTVKHEASPDSYPEESFCPEASAQYVLEVTAGLAKQHDWAAGTQFSF